MNKKILISIFSLLLLLVTIVYSNLVDNRDFTNENIKVKEKKTNIEEKDDEGPEEIKLIRENNNNDSNDDFVINKQVINNNDDAFVKHSPEIFTIYFDYDGGEEDIDNKNVTYGREYGLLPETKKIGYTFSGWYTDNGEKIESNTIENIRKNHILHAKYTKNSYSVVFDYNYLENNLYNNLGENSYWNSKNLKLITDDKTFPNENVYKFTSSSTSLNLNYQENIKLDLNKTYTFSVFIKTNKNKKLLIGLNEDLISISTDSSWKKFTKTFKVTNNEHTTFNFILDKDYVWEKDDEISIYDLSISEGNLNVKETKKEYNETLGELDNPKRNGYIFDGWYTSPEFKEKVNKDTIVDNYNKIYYAKWNPILYTLKVNPNGGVYENDSSIKTYTQGYRTKKELSIPVSNYKIIYDLNNTNAVNNKKEDIINRKFKGWIGKNNEVFNNNYIFNKDTELFAKYEENVGVVLDTIYKSNYSCSWNTSKDGNGQKYDSGSTININNNITLYASCKENFRFTRPINYGYITSEYGYRIHPIYGYKKFHSGLDMSGSDRNIYSITVGTVAKTGYNSSMGNYIIIYHNLNGQKYTSAYYHLEEKYVYAGQNVTNDTIIGKMGTTGASTGIHLHLTMYKGYLYDGSAIMVNPRDYIKFPTSHYISWYDKIS